MVNITFTIGHTTPREKRRPTIYEALKDKLNREPTHAELCAEVKRILSEVTP